MFQHFFSFNSPLKIVETNKMRKLMHHSVQEEWIFNTKQLELAKFYYKHFQWHSIEGAGNVLHVALESGQTLARFRT